MRTLLLAALVGVVPLSAELSVQKIETIVQKVQNKRVSTRNVDFVKVPSPFVVVIPADENQTEMMLQAPEKSVQFSLDAIINGRAHLNGTWVEKGQSIQGYTVEEIKPGEVLLKKEDREVHLFLPAKQEHNLLQISEG